MIDQIGTDLLSAEAPTGTAKAVDALGFATAPTNQQIIDAAKAAYTSYQPAVDAMTYALLATIKDPTKSDALAVLDGTNWASNGISSSVTSPFFASSEVQTALGVIRRSPVHSFSVGVFTKTMPSAAPAGVIGFVGDVLSIATDVGLILDLDIFQSVVTIDPDQNLQYGVWLNRTSALHDLVLGMYVNSQVQGLSVNLKTLLTKTLQPYGFMASTGATVAVPSGIFAGSTQQWAP